MKVRKPLKSMTGRGFFFASEREKDSNIYTRNNIDGTKIKQLVLPDCKKTARVRQSNSRDYNEVQRLTDNDLQYLITILSICTMLNGKRAGLMDIEELSRKDLLLLGEAYTSLNTKDWHTFTDDLNAKFINDLWSEIFE